MWWLCAYLVLTYAIIEMLDADVKKGNPGAIKAQQKLKSMPLLVAVSIFTLIVTPIMAPHFAVKFVKRIFK